MFTSEAYRHDLERLGEFKAKRNAERLAEREKLEAQFPALFKKVNANKNKIEAIQYISKTPAKSAASKKKPLTFVDGSSAHKAPRVSTFSSTGSVLGLSQTSTTTSIATTTSAAANVDACTAPKTPTTGSKKIKATTNTTSTTTSATGAKTPSSKTPIKTPTSRRKVVSNAKQNITSTAGPMITTTPKKKSNVSTTPYKGGMRKSGNDDIDDTSSVSGSVRSTAAGYSKKDTPALELITKSRVPLSNITNSPIKQMQRHSASTMNKPTPAATKKALWEAGSQKSEETEKTEKEKESVQDVLEYMLHNHEVDENTYKRLSGEGLTATALISKVGAAVSVGNTSNHSFSPISLSPAPSVRHPAIVPPQVLAATSVAVEDALTLPVPAEQYTATAAAGALATAIENASSPPTVEAAPPVAAADIEQLEILHALRSYVTVLNDCCNEGEEREGCKKEDGSGGDHAAGLPSATTAVGENDRNNAGNSNSNKTPLKKLYKDSPIHNMTQELLLVAQGAITDKPSLMQITLATEPTELFSPEAVAASTKRNNSVRGRRRSSRGGASSIGGGGASNSNSSRRKGRFSGDDWLPESPTPVTMDEYQPPMPAADVTPSAAAATTTATAEQQNEEEESSEAAAIKLAVRAKLFPATPAAEKKKKKIISVTGDELSLKVDVVEEELLPEQQQQQLADEIGCSSAIVPGTIMKRLLQPPTPAPPKNTNIPAAPATPSAPTSTTAGRSDLLSTDLALEAAAQEAQEEEIMAPLTPCVKFADHPAPSAEAAPTTPGVGALVPTSILLTGNNNKNNNKSTGTADTTTASSRKTARRRSSTRGSGGGSSSSRRSSVSTRPTQYLLANLLDTSFESGLVSAKLSGRVISRDGDHIKYIIETEAVVNEYSFPPPPHPPHAPSTTSTSRALEKVFDDQHPLGKAEKPDGEGEEHHEEETDEEEAKKERAAAEEKYEPVAPTETVTSSSSTIRLTALKRYSDFKQLYESLSAIVGCRTSITFDAATGTVHTTCTRDANHNNANEEEEEEHQQQQQENDFNGDDYMPSADALDALGEEMTDCATPSTKSLKKKAAAAAAAVTAVGETTTITTASALASADTFCLHWKMLLEQDGSVRGSDNKPVPIPPLPSRQMLGMTSGIDFDEAESTFVDLRQQYLRDWVIHLVMRQKKEGVDFRKTLRKFLSK